MNNEISLAKFLSRYACLKGKDLTKITHDDVKYLFPNFTRATFNMIKKNPNLLYRGDIILVNDGKKTIPYFVPRTDEKEEIDIQEFKMEKQDKNRIDDNNYDYMSMSIYELKCLLRKKINSKKNQICARRELERRGVILRKKYNRCDEKRKIIEEKKL